MSDVGIALLVMSIIVVAVVVIAVLLRTFGVYRLTSCFATTEEKAVLTKHEQYNGYMVGSESSEFVLDPSGKFMEYDTLRTDPKYVDIESHSPPREESARSSPVSIGTGSMGKLGSLHVRMYVTV